MIIQRKPGATKRRRRNSSKANVKFRGIPNWGSFAFGAFVGMALATFVFFKFATTDVTLKIPTSQSAKIKKTKKITSAKTAPAPRFDFYKELTKTSQSGNKPRVLDLKTPPKTINGYLVQAGSFKKRSDADALKAELALNGIISKIEGATLTDNEVWYRVITGPFKDDKAAQIQRQALKSIEIDGMVIHRYAQ